MVRWVLSTMVLLLVVMGCAGPPVGIDASAPPRRFEGETVAFDHPAEWHVERAVEADRETYRVGLDHVVVQVVRPGETVDLDVELGLALERLGDAWFEVELTSEFEPLQREVAGAMREGRAVHYVLPGFFPTVESLTVFGVPRPDRGDVLVFERAPVEDANDVRAAIARMRWSLEVD